MIRGADNLDYETLGHIVLGEPANTERNDLYRTLRDRKTGPEWFPLEMADCYSLTDPKWRFDKLSALAAKLATIDARLHRIVALEAEKMLRTWREQQESDRRKTERRAPSVFTKY